jgi:DNA-binding MarR family transcriptional regulator
MKSWLLIHQSHNLLRKAENRVMSKLGLTARKHSILLAIKNINQPVRVSDVARWLDRDANLISMRIDVMEKDGLISRIHDLDDRRSVFLEMTPKGKKVFDEANKLTGKLFQHIFTVISEDELRTLSTLLERVRIQAFNVVNPGRPIGEIQALGKRGNMPALSADSANNVQKT